MTESVFQRVYDVVDKVQMPTGEESLFVLEFPDGMILDKYEQLHLGDLLSKSAFPLYPNSKDRYELLTAQNSYMWLHSRRQEAKPLKCLYLDEDQFFFNREHILFGYLVPDPRVFESHGKPVISGESVNVIPSESVVETLTRAHLFRKYKRQVLERGFGSSDSNNSVASVWPGDFEKFCLDYQDSLIGASFGAFVKTSNP